MEVQVIYKATPLVQVANTPHLYKTSAFAQLGPGKNIASCEAYLVLGTNSPDLWSNLAGCGQEVTDLAYTLFDHNGRFREKFHHHSVAKGTNVWGTEINNGQSLLIEIFKVSPTSRRKGIGTDLFKALLAEVDKQLTSDYFIFVRPGILPDDEADQDLSETEIGNVAEVFYRSLGFKRVGNTAWFGYSNNPNHPSRHLSPTLDLRISEPPPRSSNPSQWPAINKLMTILGNPKNSDDASLQRLRQALPESDTNARNDPRWEVQSSPEGDTLLHKAVLACKPETVKYILTVRPDLANRPNAIYYTPLHVLEEAMEKLCHPFPASSLEGSRPVRPFLAYSTACLECYRLLKAFSEPKGETLLSFDASLACLI